jgi:hypothetical protein
MSSALFSSTLMWLVVASALAVIATAAELVGRFKDAPGRALRTAPAMLYMAINGMLAGMVFVGLHFANPPKNSFTMAEQVLLACFVARVVVRLRVAGLKGADGQISETGPGQFSERLLAAVTRQLNREEAVMRLRAVSEPLVGMDYQIAFGFFVSELMSAMQDLSDDDKRDIGEALQVIDSRKDLDDETRIDMLGYLVMDYGGQDFLDQLVHLYFVRFPSRQQTVARAA